MKTKHILVIRLSAMGDVAMTVPVLQQLLQQNPGIQLTVLTQKLFTPLFEPLERTNIFVADTKGKHKGFAGLVNLFKELKRHYQFDAVADLHNVLRSRVISLLFRTSGIKIGRIEKGRKEKKQLTRKEDKRLVQLKTSFQRYADVFKELGLPLSLNIAQPVYSKRELPAAAMRLFIIGRRNICIAPFAKHKEKMYPLEKMKVVVKTLAGQNNVQVFFLGGGQEETEILNRVSKEFPGSISLAGKFSFKEELAIISNMDMLVSMDSANMHLASLFGVPVISIWGATHPYAGFYGWNQPGDNAVQIDLHCRPCSVFGNKPCYRGDHACMEQLPETMILQKLLG